jgi:hypothetical protein
MSTESPDNDNSTDGTPLEPTVPAVYPDGMRSGLADYVTIATAAINRGFKVTPVHPLEKRGVLHNWNKNPTTTLSEVLQHAKDFANYNVGVVGRRGVGNYCFLDIDADRVTERIEEEAHEKMPLTYTVCSRPQSARWKRHFYFKQTSYSYSRLKKEANRKDVTKWVTSENTGVPMHPTEYDLKGVGGGGLVVAAGSVRKDGETYTVINDVPVLDIPKWLVDWLVEDLSKYQSACAKERRDRAVSVAAIPAEQQAARKKMGDGSAFDISESDIFTFLNWRACQFAKMGTQGKLLERVLTQQVEKFCAGGKKFVESESGRRQIHKAATNKQLKFGNASFFNQLGEKNRAAYSEGSCGLTIFSKPTRKGLMVAAMSKFPDPIAAEDGYERLKKALARKGFKLDSKTKAGQKAVQEARKAAGFHTEQTTAGWLWVRNTE